MRAQISPMLAVDGGAAAIAFSTEAFGAIELWRIDAGGDVVAGLSINGADLFVAQETPSRGTRAPGAVGHTTVRIELFVGDPREAHVRALAAGATDASPVVERVYETVGPIRSSACFKAPWSIPSATTG